MSPVKILKNTKEFKKVYSKGKSVADRNLVLYVLPNGESGIRFGFSVSKKYGQAVERNRIKRQLREICRLGEGKVKSGFDLVFIARAAAKNANYWGLEKSFFNLLRKSNLLGEEGKHCD